MEIIKDLSDYLLDYTQSKGASYAEIRGISGESKGLA